MDYAVTISPTTGFSSELSLESSNNELPPGLENSMFRMVERDVRSALVTKDPPHLFRFPSPFFTSLADPKDPSLRQRATVAPK